jgi:hypothetical protein
LNIHVLPTQPSQPLDNFLLWRRVKPKNDPANPLDPIDIPGLLEVAIEEYTDWHLSRVGTESFKENIKKSCDIALDNCLDLKQICGENPDFFVKQVAKIGTARRFVADISL